MTNNSLRHVIVAIVFSLFFLTSLLTPLCASAEPVLELSPVTHDITPVSQKNSTLSEVVQDSVTVSGKTDPGSQVLVKKTIYDSVTENSAAVSSDGSFNTKITFEVGPGFTQGVEKGEIKLSVTAIKGSSTKEAQVPLANTTSSASAPQVVGAALNAGVAGYPHTFVVYNNPWFFYTGRYVNDEGTAVQTSKDEAATQLAKFSSVSLHYTDDASSVTLIKQKNPAAKVFAYINPMFCYQSSDPNSEYQQVVKNHPEWFLYPDAASRQSTTNPIIVAGSEQVMDLTTGWRDEVIKLSKEALAKGFDGLYIDCICDDPSLCYGYGSNTAPSGDWHAALNTYLDQVRVAGKLNFYNGQCPAVVPPNQDFLDRTEGWMDEGFISYKGWKLSAIDMPQYAASKNKFTMFYAVNPDIGARHFYFTSALLSDGYFFYSRALPEDWNTQWFSDYGLYLGDPSGQAYQVSGLNGVWARDYAGAKVIVNPTSSSVTVSMSGYTDLSGKALTSVTISPNDGVIVKKRVSSQLSLTVNNANPTAGQSITFSGNLKTSATTPALLATSPVYLHVSKDNVNWSLATGTASTTTDTNGGYTFTQSLSTGTYYFRTYYPGTSQYREAFSPTVKVTVSAPTTTRQLTQLSLSASTTTPTAGQSITFSGIYQTRTTTPTRISGAPVYLHVSKDNINWSLASASAASTSNGVYGFSGGLDQGMYYVRAYSPGTSQYREAFSPTVKITVGVTATRQLTQLSLSVSNANPTTSQSITFSGNLKTSTLTASNIASAPVYLHVSKDNINWSLVSGTPASTGTNGAYTVAKSFSAGTYYFRTYYPGTSQYREAFSPTVKVTVSAASTTRQLTQLSLSVTNANPIAGQSISFSGVLKTSTATPVPLTSAPIYLHWSADKTHWSLAASSTATTSTNGAYGFTGSLPAGTYYFRTYYAGTTQYREAFSSVIMVVVK